MYWGWSRGHTFLGERHSISQIPGKWGMKMENTLAVNRSGASKQSFTSTCCLRWTSIAIWSLPIPYWSQEQKLSDCFKYWYKSRPLQGQQCPRSDSLISQWLPHTTARDLRQTICQSFVKTHARRLFHTVLLVLNNSASNSSEGKMKKIYITLTLTLPLPHFLGPGTFALNSHTYNLIFQKVLDQPLV